MEDLHEGDVVYHKPTQERCTIVSLFNDKAVVRTNENITLECFLHELAVELDTVNVF